jgi:hypothetical protein
VARPAARQMSFADLELLQAHGIIKALAIAGYEIKRTRPTRR